MLQTSELAAHSASIYSLPAVTGEAPLPGRSAVQPAVLPTATD